MTTIEYYSCNHKNHNSSKKCVAFTKIKINTKIKTASRKRPRNYKNKQVSLS